MNAEHPGIDPAILDLDMDKGQAIIHFERCADGKAACDNCPFTCKEVYDAMRYFANELHKFK